LIPDDPDPLIKMTHVNRQSCISLKDFIDLQTPLSSIFFPTPHPKTNIIRHLEIFRRVCFPYSVLLLRFVAFKSLSHPFLSLFLKCVIVGSRRRLCVGKHQCKQTWNIVHTNWADSHIWHTNTVICSQRLLENLAINDCMNINHWCIGQYFTSVKSMTKYGVYVLYIGLNCRFVIHKSFLLYVVKWCCKVGHYRDSSPKNFNSVQKKDYPKKHRKLGEETDKYT